MVNLLIIMNIYALCLSSVLSLTLSMFFIYSLRPIACKLQLIDFASGRKQHEGEIPLLGGIGIWLGFCLSILVLPISLAPFRSLFAASIILIVVGILDDMRELNPGVRAIAQLFAASLVCFWGNLKLLILGDIFFVGPIELGFFSAIITLISIVGIINSINMIDGIDGLAGSVSAVQLILLGYIAYSSNLVDSLYLIVVLLSAILGFLIFNFPFPRRKRPFTFMGDSGSFFIGLMLVWFLIALSQNSKSFATPTVMIWIMVIPIFDTISVMILRIINGESPFHPRRDHMHHVLQEIGYNPRTIDLIASGCTFIFGSFGIFLCKYKISDSISFLLFCTCSIIYLIWKLKFYKQPS